VLDQMRGALRHAPRSARGAEPSALATKRHELVVAAIGAAQAQEAVRQDAALQERVELGFDELRQAGTKGLFGLGKEALGVLLHQAVQRGLLGSVALVVHRARSSRAALWLARPRGGVHGKDMAQGRVCTVSLLRAYRHRPSV